MSPKPPPLRTDFVSQWDECMYTLGQLSHWYWNTHDVNKARRWAGDLETVLESLDRVGATRRGAEGWALIAAAREDWGRCLASKQHEVDIIRHVLAEGIDPRAVSPLDLAIAVEEFVLWARAADEPQRGVELISTVLADGFFDDEQSRILKRMQWEDEQGR